MRNNICYSTRDYSNDQKISGGTFGGKIDNETVERLVKSYSVVIKPSGTAVFVDKSNREIRLYLMVDPSETTKGKEVLAVWRSERAKLEAERERIEKEETDEIDTLMSGLSNEEIIRRLRGLLPHIL